MKNKYVIDGRQLTGQIGGVQRYIYEIVRELDSIVKPDEFEIVIPPKENLDCEFTNIDIVREGILKGLLWEQISLPLYIFRNKRIGIYPCTIVPMLHPIGIVVIHDVMPKVLPEIRKSMGCFWGPLLLLNYRIATRKADLIVTVSKTSAKDISNSYNIPLDSIQVIGNAWQHINRISIDESCFLRNKSLIKGEYYFTLSANRLQKNFKWIYEVAKKNPQSIFAIAGTQEEWQKTMEYDAPNIIHLGYVSNEEVKALMTYCKAFLFPSIYEGFGIPPLEALACGAEIVLSSTSCLPEIYGKSARYINPYDYDVNLDLLLEDEVEPAEKTLNMYSWRESAEKLYELCQNLDSQ